MSFWEDRFVHRPHASAVPPNVPQGTFGSDFTRTPEAGHMWFQAMQPADQVVGEPVEAELEHGSDLLEETSSDLTVAEAAAVEYRRSGLLRRRKPFPVAGTPENEAEVAETANGNGNGNGHVAWEKSFAPPDTDVAPAALNGNGHAADVQGVDVHQDKPVYGTEFETVGNGNGNGNGSSASPERTPELEVQADDAASVDEDAPNDDFTIADETHEISVPEPRRRGLFRRHDPLSDSIAVDDDAADEDLDEAAEAESPEHDTFEGAPYYVADASSDDEFGADDNRADDTDPGAEPSFEEADAFVMSEHDETQDSGAGEPTHDEQPAPDEPFVLGDEPSHEAEPVHDEPAVLVASESTVASEPSDADAPEAPAPDAPTPFAENEPQVELLSETPHDVDDLKADAPPEPAQQVPVPERKRNGNGSSRGGKKVVGLKIGASQIAAAVVSGAGESQALVGLARRPLEHGVVVDGELRDPEALTQALKSFFKEHDLPSKNVRLGLSSSRVGVRTFEISGIEDESRFDNAVRFKAHEVLPVAAHESVLDYRVVEDRFTESGEISRRVLLVVAPRDQVEPYIEACRSAGLRLAGVDLEAFGLLRAFVPPLGSRNRAEDSATVVVAIGHEASTLLVAGGGVCEFTRVFDWGGGALQAAIADELDVPRMEAHTILTHLSLSGPGRHLDSLEPDDRNRALEAVKTRLTPFARELVSSLQFYQTQPESLGIREILITGGTSHLEGLADSLHQMIGVSVSVGDPLARVDVQTEIPAALEAMIGSLAVPIGLAIEDEDARSVNLLPKDSSQTRKRPRALVLAAPIAAAVPLAALAFLFVQASGTTSDRQAELDAVQAEIAALPEPTRPIIDPALAGQQAARATAVAQILGGRLRWERVLGDITRVLPSGVSLTELVATAPQPTTPIPAAPTETASTESTPAPAPAPIAAATAPTGVLVTGYALDYATIARTLARIQAVPSLTNAQLQSATPIDRNEKRVVEFKIIADLAIPGGAQ